MVFSPVPSPAISLRTLGSPEPIESEVSQIKGGLGQNCISPTENFVIFSPVPSPAISLSSELGSSEPVETDILQIKKTKNFRAFLEAFDLKEFLDCSQVGKALLSWYEIKGGFDSTRQSYLVDLITLELLNYTT